MFFAKAMLVGLAAIVVVPTAASDPVGVYAVVDRVTLAPNNDAPETIQIWGVFALANKNDPNSYQAAQRGYLYLSVNNKNERATRAEWKDLQSVASGKTPTPIGFGSRWESNVRIRPETE